MGNSKNEGPILVPPNINYKCRNLIQNQEGPILLRKTQMEPQEGTLKTLTWDFKLVKLVGADYGLLVHAPNTFKYYLPSYSLNKCHRVV